MPRECEEYAEAVEIDRVLHTDILSSSITANDLDITMVTQLDSNRLEILENLINRWKGYFLFEIKIYLYLNFIIYDTKC